MESQLPGRYLQSALKMWSTTLLLRSIYSPFLYYDVDELNFFQCVIWHLLHTWGLKKKKTHTRKTLWYLCYQQKYKQLWFMYRFFHGSHHCGIWMTLQTFNSYNNFVKQWSIVVYILPRGNWSTELIKQHKVKQEIRYWMLISRILVHCFFYKKDDACQLKKKR